MVARGSRGGDHGGRAAVAARAIERRDALIVRATVALVGCGIAEIVLALAARWLARRNPDCLTPYRMHQHGE